MTQTQLLPSIWRSKLLKSELRKLLRPLRQGLSPEYRNKASLAAARYFIESPYFQAKKVGCYMALAEEMDTQPIIQALWDAQKFCYLPIITSVKDKTLRFARYEAQTKLELNRYQVLEPQNSAQELEGSQLEVVLVPLLAFDSLGNRLGTGGGYYDRTFSFMLDKHLAKQSKPHFIGLAYEVQKVDQIPHEVFDVPLEAVITEKGILIF